MYYFSYMLMQVGTNHTPTPIPTTKEKEEINKGTHIQMYTDA